MQRELRNLFVIVATAATAASMACGHADASADTGADETSTDGEGEATETDDPTVEDTGTIFDVASDADLGGSGPGSCKVVDGMDGTPPTCDDKAPPESFDPAVEWAWMGDGDERYSIVIPLVANLTDDNDDGAIDLCDTPDVVVVAYSSSETVPGMKQIVTPGHIYVLDGATGAVHFRIDEGIDWTDTPALADIDGDGLPEIITTLADEGGSLVAFEHDGTKKWVSSEPPPVYGYFASLAIADLDNDEAPEIIAGGNVFDGDGNFEWAAGIPAGGNTTTMTTAADLDDDGDLELVFGHAAIEHDGTMNWQASLGAWGYPHVGDFDDDPEPEILITTYKGISMVEHDGTVILDQEHPIVDARRPATIHDFDGDGRSEFAASHGGGGYTLYETDASVAWTAFVDDSSGAAAGTAFDFLGDGVAEAMYGDQVSLFVFDELGGVLMETPRTSLTGHEYPIVADIDNDGSAEVLVVSSESFYGDEPSPTVQAIRDVQDRWIPARRIWNQHTYHVTNVREDGTIPQFEQPHWKQLNTFRTQAQIGEGGICKPEPEG